MTSKLNKLSEEKSLYLKQHAKNPVNWLPMGEEAIALAKEQNRPIFLSIGYSSCHWCHVMAHESFEDQETADYLNENFVCIKVDREEYPDVDNYYQQASSLFVQRGGWPLSAFLLPDMRPFFVGTYYPKLPREGMTAFTDLLKELNRAYKEEKNQVEENAKRVTDTIKNGQTNKQKVEFNGHFPAPMAIMDALKKYADEDHGGYGGAPKFPQFSFYEWAIEQMLEGMIDRTFGEHIVKTVEKMLCGGIHDHARGGLHRYSTDETWTVPHFEKMLYDQAGLLKTLAKFSLVYPSALVYDTILNTLDYLDREMLSEEQYFFSAQDADSEGEEGLYFTFTKDEFLTALIDFDQSQEDSEETLVANQDKILKWFNIQDGKGNFEKGLNVITLNEKHKNEFYNQEGWEIVRKVRTAILRARAERIPPATDNKGVASWNFMTISALIDVMQYCQIDVIKRRASDLFNRALEGSYKHFMSDPKAGPLRIKHSTTLSKSLPYAEDYIFFAESQLRIYEVTGNQVFKENFLGTLEYLTKEYLKDGELMTRPVSFENEVSYPNQALSVYDQSFKSPLATYIGLIRRANLLDPSKNFLEKSKAAFEKATQDSLLNPLHAGEALRSLSYPKDAYRILKAPVSWLKDDRYFQMIPYFLPRFILSYKDVNDQSETFEICREDACEMTGNNLQEFLDRLAPKKEA